MQHIPQLLNLYYGKNLCLFHLLLQSLPANEKAWVDGSVCFELHHDNHATPLTDAQHWLLTGTHPGLPFEIEVEGEEHPYLGLVTFSRENSLPKFIEVNAMVSGKSLAEGGRFALRVSSPGQDPNWPGWET